MAASLNFIRKLNNQTKSFFSLKNNGGIVIRCLSSSSSSSSSSSHFKYLKHEIHEEQGIASITLANSKKRNALSLPLMQEFTHLLHRLKEVTEIRALILRAEGSVFSAGHDLRELGAENKEHHSVIFNTCRALMTQISLFPVPVICEVGGLATAAGCQLVASCDLVVASRNASFATPGVKVGLFCSAPAVPIIRSLPKKIANKMLYTGEPISAEEAFQHGLVSLLVSPDALSEETTKLARTIASSSRAVLVFGKKVLREQSTHESQDRAYDIATPAMTENLACFEDGKEGIAAFVNKRAPKWTHG